MALVAAIDEKLRGGRALADKGGGALAVIDVTDDGRLVLPPAFSF